MQRIGTPSGLFDGGNPSTNTKGTVLTADWLNAIQEELAALVESMGMTIDPDENDQLLTALSGRLINIQVFDAAGVFSYTKTPGTRFVIADVQGAGAAGGGVPATNASQVATGSGGTAGARARGIFYSGFDGAIVTVGAAGVGSPGVAGTNGGASSFGALLSAAGGIGGSLGPAVTTSGINGNPAMAVASGGNIINQPGRPATLGVIAYGAAAYGGDGGSSAFGSPGSGFSSGPGTLSGDGFDAAGHGAGGGGALAITNNATPRRGGHGTLGKVIIEEYA